MSASKALFDDDFGSDDPPVGVNPSSLFDDDGGAPKDSAPRTPRNE